MHPLPPKDELPPLVLPPLGYPPVLAPCAEAINFNERIMGVYLNDILPGEGGAGWQLRSRAAGQARSQAAVRACSLPVMVTACFGSAPCPALALMVQSLKHLPLSPPPAITPGGDDGNYGSAATLDVLVLQALSTRIHYGKFVAEAKFRCARRRGGALYALVLCALVLQGGCVCCCARAAAWLCPALRLNGATFQRLGMHPGTPYPT